MRFIPGRIYESHTGRDLTQRWLTVDEIRALEYLSPVERRYALAPFAAFDARTALCGVNYLRTTVEYTTRSGGKHKEFFDQPLASGGYVDARPLDTKRINDLAVAIARASKPKTYHVWIPARKYGKSLVQTVQESIKAALDQQSEQFEREAKEASQRVLSNTIREFEAWQKDTNEYFDNAMRRLARVQAEMDAPIATKLFGKPPVQSAEQARQTGDVQAPLIKHLWKTAKEVREHYRNMKTICNAFNVPERMVRSERPCGCAADLPRHECNYGFEDSEKYGWGV